MTGGNVAAEFLAAATGRLDAPFLIDAERTWTYGGFFDRLRAHAAVLADAGAQPGDRVLVQVEKSPEAVALYVACLWAGTAHVPLNPAFTADERHYFIDDAEPAVVVVHPGVAEGPAWLTLGAGMPAEGVTRSEDGRWVHIGGPVIPVHMVNGDALAQE